MPYASAPAVGQVGDEYYNTGNKVLYLSDGTAWNPVSGQSAPYAPVSATPPNASNPTTAPPVGLLWVDTADNPSWAPINFTYTTTLTAPTTASSPYTVTHGLNTRNVHVQMWGATTGLLIQTQVLITGVNTIQISVAQNIPENVNVVVMGVTGTPAPINPGDTATKLYVDQRTPNLPPPVTSGSGIQTFTDALGDVWVAQNGVYSGTWKRARDVIAAGLRKTTAQAIPVNGPTQVNFDSANPDPYGIYVAGSGVYNVPIAGRYLIACNLNVLFSVAAPRQFGTIYINGSETRRGADIIGGSQLSSSGMVTAMIQLAANDAISLRIYTTIAGNTATNPNICWADIAYMGTG